MNLLHSSEFSRCDVRKPKTCLRFPLDGLAFTAYLHINISIRRISSFVILFSSKDLPPSKVPALWQTLYTKRLQVCFRLMYFKVMPLPSSLNNDIKMAKHTHTLISSPIITSPTLLGTKDIQSCLKRIQTYRLDNTLRASSLHSSSS